MDQFTSPETVQVDYRLFCGLADHPFPCHGKFTGPGLCDATPVGHATKAVDFRETIWQSPCSRWQFMRTARMEAKTECRDVSYDGQWGKLCTYRYKTNRRMRSMQ